MTVITSEHFVTNLVDINGDTLMEQEVDGLADAPDKLATLNRFDDQEVNVITAIYLDINGVIKEIEIGAAGGTQSKKFPANTLFKDAPEGSKLRLRRFNFAQYKFPPGRCFSEWVDSENIDWSVMRTNNIKDGEFPDSEYKDIGVSPWVSRLHVTTREEANTVTVRLVAIPRQDINNLPGTATGAASEGYPVILIGEFPAIMAGEQEEARGDGLPFYPVCINRGPPEANITIPTSEFLRTAYPWLSGPPRCKDRESRTRPWSGQSLSGPTTAASTRRRRKRTPLMR